MILEIEGKAPIENPSEHVVRDNVMSLRSHLSTFGSLTDATGNYVQVAGGRPWCMVEWRQTKPLQHSRAYTTINRRPYKDGAPIHFTAGPVSLREDEWILQKQAAEIFIAFLKGDEFPDFVCWRPINRILGIPE